MNRPTIITILSVAHYVIGALLLLLTLDEIAIYILYKTGGLSHLANPPFNIPYITGDYPYLMVIALYGILSFISFYTGYGLWKGWKWIWYLEVGLNFIVIINILFMVIISSNIFIGLIAFLNLVVIYLLREENVRKYFQINLNVLESDLYTS